MSACALCVTAEAVCWRVGSLGWSALCNFLQDQREAHTVGCRNNQLCRAALADWFTLAAIEFGTIAPVGPDAQQGLAASPKRYGGPGTVTFAYEHRDDRTCDLLKLHLNGHHAAALGRREKSSERRLVLPGPQRPIEFQAAIDLGGAWRGGGHIRRRQRCGDAPGECDRHANAETKHACAPH